MSFYQSKISGTGSHFPEKVVTNKDLEKIIETSDEWIYTRTGIKQRYVCSKDGGEFPSDLAYQATLKALKTSGLKPNDINCILFATCTPDMILPNTAAILQKKLGITNNCACLDINAACSGFVYGFNMADSMIKTGMFKNVLIIGSEMLSSINDWSDRGTSILFGDGCGVAILSRIETPDVSTKSDLKNSPRILSSSLSADGNGNDFFTLKAGGSARPIDQEILSNNDQYMYMHGQEMFKYAVRTLAENARVVIENAGLTLSDVDWLIPHQANSRIIDATCKKLNIPMEKVIINIETCANTSAATVPTALDMAIMDGKIKRGDIVLMDAFGAGLTAGATLFVY
jgi:3-oxoacyl-[acyl-carrier-protein] synthase III